MKCNYHFTDIVKNSIIGSYIHPQNMLLLLKLAKNEGFSEEILWERERNISTLSNRIGVDYIES